MQLPTREEAFLQRWAEERESYLAWGELVHAEILGSVAEKISPEAIEAVIKVNCPPRLKTDSSLLDKAFYRGKDYEDPYQQIEDKVGVRFVVLRPSQMAMVVDAVRTSTTWSASEDRNFVREIEESPLVFKYAAVHYVVRSLRATNFRGIAIPADIPCEVQIKTILQHAFSELTHDTLYKPQYEPTPKADRAAATSMALLEATDHYFEDVVGIMDEQRRQFEEPTVTLSLLYEQKVGRPPSTTSLNTLLLKSLLPSLDLLGGEWLADVRDFLDSNEFLGDSIAGHAPASLVYQQPSILAVYYLTSRAHELVRDQWPLPDRELENVFADLSIAMERDA